MLGDVTGHGIDAAAHGDGEFVFRSLARLYPEPGPFLGAANDVVVEEIGAGKFITMLYLTIDIGRGEVACASAGHPQPRLLDASGAVTSLDAEPSSESRRASRYSELRRPSSLRLGASLYTAGLVEARRAGGMDGEERLDRVRAANRGLPPEQLAAVVLEECRRWVAGDLRDDCAIVVVRRT